MRGYTVKKGDRYYAVIYEGVDPATGKEKRRWYPAGTRKGDADKMVTELVKRRNDGDYRAPEKLTMGDYLTGKWLPAQRSQLRASTYHSYKRTIELHVIPTLGKVPMSRVMPEDLDALYAKLLESGRRNKRGGPLSPASVRYVHRVLRKAFGDAVRKGTLVRNPASLADPPKDSAEVDGSEMHVWTAAELARFLAAISEERLFPAYHLAACTGMRRGEILGLRWADVDLTAKRVSVRQALITVAYEMRLSDVKTAAGRRTIDINRGDVQVLANWRRRQAEERLLVGPAWEDHGLVFCRPDGTPIHPERLSRTFDQLVARHALPPVRLHDLRHTHASLLLKDGVPIKVVSERLGHASATFTMNTYQWLLPGMQAEAAAAFERILATPEPAEETDEAGDGE
jgi:integrase